MKKSELRQIIREEVNRLNESVATVLSRDLGGYDHSDFLHVAWHMDIVELESLLEKSKYDLKWLNAHSRGIMGLFHKKDAQWVKTRIKFLNQIITSKKKDSEYIPDNYKG